MSTRYRFQYLVLLVLLLSALRPAVSMAAPQGQRTFERAQLLRTLDLIRQGQARMAVPAFLARAKAVQLTGGTGIITGSLAGLLPAGFASASVVAWIADSTQSREGVAIAAIQPDGKYRIEGLSAGAYYVTASAKGYIPQYFKGAKTLSDAVPVQVGEGETVEGIDFVMEPLSVGTGSIAGTVRLERDGQPVVEAGVQVFSPDNPFLSSFAQTDKEGKYLISGLPNGAYLVQVWASGTLPEFFDNAQSPDLATRVEVREGAVTEHIDFSLATGGTISGYVRDAAGTPIPGAYVQAYVYESMPVQIDTAVVQEGEAAAPAPAPDGMMAEPMPADQMLGKRGGYIAPSGGWAISDETGFYRIGGLGTGKYYVMAQVSGRWYYAVRWYDAVSDFMQASPVSVTMDVETPGIDLKLDLPVLRSALSGRVTDRKGQPVAEAFVTVQSAAQWGRGAGEPGMINIWAYAVTDKEGIYTVEELPAGTYLVAAAAQAGWEYLQRWYQDALTPEAATPVTLGEGERTGRIDVVLPVQVGTASLSGVVRDSKGQALPWAFIEVRPAAAILDPSQPANLWAYAQTDSQGAYRVDRLPAGVYAVHATYGTGDMYGQGWYDGSVSPEALTPVSLAEGEGRGNIDFDLTVRPIYGSIEGSITDAATGAPLARAYIELSPVRRDQGMYAPFGYYASHAFTDEAGHFVLTYIPEGSYWLAVYADGAASPPAAGDAGGKGALVEVIGGEVTIHNLALPQMDNGEGIITGTVTVNYGGPMPLSDRAPAPAWESATVDIAKDSGMAAMPPEVAVVLAYPLVDGQVSTATSYTAVTAPDGTYALRGLAPGDYVAMSFAPNSIGVYYGDTYAPELSTPIHVDGQQPTAGIDFTLAPAYFWRLAAGDGAMPTAGMAGSKGAESPGPGNSGTAAVHGRVTASDGKAIAGATVYLLDEAAQPVAYEQTGPDGSFELSGVAPGEYRLYAGKLGLGGTYNGNVSTFAQAEALTLNGGAQEINLILSLGPITAVEEEEEAVLPRTLTLLGNYPNPFNPSTQIGFAVPNTGRATLRVYNALGQQVAVLFDGMAEAGRQYTLSFQAGALSAGTYIYTLEVGGEVRSRKMALVK